MTSTTTQCIDAKGKEYITDGKEYQDVLSKLQEKYPDFCIEGTVEKASGYYKMKNATKKESHKTCVCCTCHRVITTRHIQQHLRTHSNSNGKKRRCEKPTAEEFTYVHKFFSKDTHTVIFVTRSGLLAEVSAFDEAYRAVKAALSEAKALEAEATSRENAAKEAEAAIEQEAPFRKAQEAVDAALTGDADANADAHHTFAYLTAESVATETDFSTPSFKLSDFSSHEEMDFEISSEQVWTPY